MKRRERIPNREFALDACVERFMKDIAGHMSLDEERASAVEYAVVELLNNAYEHGNKRDEHKTIVIEWEVNDGGLTLSVEDEGEGFTPRIPDAPPPMKERRGRGLWSLKGDVHSMTFNDKGNKITVQFTREK